MIQFVYIISRQEDTMKVEKINQLFADTAYIRTGGSAEELKCAEYAFFADKGMQLHPLNF